MSSILVEKLAQQTQIGVIPLDWKIAPLQALVDQARPICYGILMPGKPIPGGVPVVKVTNIKHGRIHLEDLLLTSPDIDEAYKRSRLGAGDLLLTIRGTTGRIAIVPSILAKANITQDTARLSIVAARTVPLYVFYTLLSSRLQRYIDFHTIGQAVKGINIAEVKKIPIPLPPLHEQRAIAEALGDVDALIAAQQKLIAKKQAIKTATMQRLLTGKQRLPGFGEGCGCKQTEIGLIPEDWEVANLGNVCGMKSGSSITAKSIDDHGSYPCYGGNGLRGYTSSYTHDGRHPLIGRQGALCGNVTAVEGRFFASEHAIVVAVGPKADVHWITFVLESMDLNQYSESSAQPGLSVQKVLELKTGFPVQIEEQRAIAQVLTDLDAEITALEKRLAKTKDIKQGMMQELLTGRTRLV